MASTSSQEEIILHIVVVGFHHKRGCQVEYSYPPLVEGTTEDSGILPVQWKYLPTLAIPDGAHNHKRDTIYFHLKNTTNTKTAVYGVSCYRQMDAKDLLNKTDDITRETVQKSVTVLTTVPLYGAIAAKLELITHAWFEQKDFTQTALLREAYHSLKASVSGVPMTAQAYMGLNIHEAVKLYRHKILQLFKLIALERKVVFFMSPVHNLCNVILSVLALYPGLLEQGLVESVKNMRTPLSAQHQTNSTDPFGEPRISAVLQKDVSLIEKTSPESSKIQDDHRVSTEADDNFPPESIVSLSHQSLHESVSDRSLHENRELKDVTNSTRLTSTQPSVIDIDPLCIDNQQAVYYPRVQPRRESSECTTTVSVTGLTDGETVQVLSNQTIGSAPAAVLTDVTEADHNILEPANSNFVFPYKEVHVNNATANSAELDSVAAVHDIDVEDQGCFSCENSVSLVISDDESSDLCDHGDQPGRKCLSKPQQLTLDVQSENHCPLRVVPVLSPTSLRIDDSGFPLAIFTKGSVFHPYLSLAYYDILEDVNIRSFVIGASNILFKQRRHNIDVVVEGDPASVQIFSKDLQRQLQLTTEDLRFADALVKQVEVAAAEGQFLESTEWEGGDEWIRSQFRNYLESLMATVLAEDERLLTAFNTHFVNAWKTTHNYKVWRATVQRMDIIPGHPSHGGSSLTDIKLQLARSDRGRRLTSVMDHAGQAVADTSKVVGGAISSAKSLVSSWWSNMTSPQ